MSPVPRTEETITLCLSTLAANAGLPTQTVTALSEMGMDPVPDRSTLVKWRDVMYPARYAELREVVQQQIEPVIIANVKEHIVAAQQAARLAVEHTVFRLEKGVENRPAEVAVAMQKVLNGSIDKLQLLTGKPTSITENRSPDEIIRALEAQGISVELDPREVQELSEAKRLNGSV